MGDADAIIFHGNAHPSRPAYHLYGDFGMLARILDGIINEVVDGMRKMGGIGLDERVGKQGVGEVCFLGRFKAVVGNDIGDNIVQVSGFDL